MDVVRCLVFRVFCRFSMCDVGVQDTGTRDEETRDENRRRKEVAMRHARVRAEGCGCYHVVSRIVDRNFRMDDAEKEVFRGMMRRAEAFCGVRVLTYAVMSNHFHLLVEVPERVEIDEAELVRLVYKGTGS